MSYSVLMSVYIKESPSNLKEAMDSIFNQTIKTDDFVLVCDGPLTKELDEVIDFYKNKFPSLLNIVRLDENSGLGKALKCGLEYCKNEKVLRADSDDISLANRAEVQIRLLDVYDICSSNVLMFSNDKNSPSNLRVLPETQKKIYKFSKRRSPFNHPSVAFLKSKVLKVGSYEDLPLKEDWMLWIKMLQSNCSCINTQEPLVLMRENQSTIKRRRNRVAYNSLIKLFKYMRKTNYIGYFRYLMNRVEYAMQYYLPSKFVTFVYKVFLRKRYMK